MNVLVGTTDCSVASIGLISEPQLCDLAQHHPSGVAATPSATEAGEDAVLTALKTTGVYSITF